MKTLLRNLVVACALTSTPGCAGLIFSLNPASGTVSGLPGDTVGWGFTFITDDANHYLLNMVEFCIGVAIPNTGNCNNTAVGTFTDFAAGVNGLIVGPLFNPSGYSESFNNGSQTGLGSFAISPLAALQPLDGTIYVYYDVYAGDPFNGGIQQPSGQSFQTVQVNVGPVSAVPEPGSLLLIGAGGFALWLPTKARILARRYPRRNFSTKCLMIRSV
jgi:hypothetical protein